MNPLPVVTPPASQAIEAINTALDWAGSKRAQYAITRSAGLAAELAYLPMYMFNVTLAAFSRSA